jgi:aminodeoxyfutalosine synthase
MTKVLEEITTKAGAGEPLSDAEAQALFLTHDIIALGVAADAARTRRHADRVTFVRVADVPLHADGDASWPASTGEVRMTGPLEDLDVALARARQIVGVATVPVSAFSLVDLEAAAARAGEPLAATLARVREAGIEAVADASFDRLLDPVAAFRAARDAGVLVPRVTLDRIPADGMLSLYRRVRDVHRATGAIRAFAPLPRRMSSAHPTTGFEDVKHVAIARLLLDAIETIQVDWRLYGPKLAQVALTFGADDLDAVPASDEAPDGPRRAPLEEVRRNIAAASRVPVERDGRFNVINA